MYYTCKITSIDFFKMLLIIVYFFITVMQQSATEKERGRSGQFNVKRKYFAYNFLQIICLLHTIC